MPGAPEGDMESLCNRDRVSICEDQKVLEMDGGDGCIVIGTHFMPMNCTLIS